MIVVYAAIIFFVDMQVCLSLSNLDLLYEIDLFIDV